MQRIDLFPLTGRAEAGAIIEAEVERHDERDGLTELRSRAGLWRLPRIDAAVGSRLRLHVRARDVMLAKSEPVDVSALNVFAGVVAEVGDGTGPIMQVRVDCGGETLVARLTRYSVQRLALEPGTPVHALVKSVAFDRRSVGAAAGASLGGASADAGDA
jgi:molybdate transport system ATP-binding protein